MGLMELLRKYFLLFKPIAAELTSLWTFIKLTQGEDTLWNISFRLFHETQ